MRLMTLRSRAEQKTRSSRGSPENPGPPAPKPIPREVREPRERVHALQLPADTLFVVPSEAEGPLFRADTTEREEERLVFVVRNGARGEQCALAMVIMRAKLRASDRNTYYGRY